MSVAAERGISVWSWQFVVQVSGEILHPDGRILRKQALTFVQLLLQLHHVQLRDTAIGQRCYSASLELLTCDVCACTHGFDGLLQRLVVCGFGAAVGGEFLGLFPCVGLLLLRFGWRRNLLLVLLLQHLLKTVKYGLGYHVCKHTQRNADMRERRLIASELMPFHTH